MSDERRGEIIRLLRGSARPLTGAQLSDALGVTRQVIVADIALLRAAGETVMATPQGYILARVPAQPVVHRTIAAKHGADLEQMREELYIVVDNGGSIVDVTVEHPLYGEITANLQLHSRHDIDLFVEKLRISRAEPLLVLTGGLHLHTIQARDNESLERIIHELHKTGFLADE